MQVFIDSRNEPYKWSIYDVYGRILARDRNNSRFILTLSKSKIGSGLIILQVNQGNKIACQKVFFN